VYFLLTKQITHGLHTKLVSDFIVDKHLQKTTRNALFYLVVLPVRCQGSRRVPCSVK